MNPNQAHILDLERRLKIALDNYKPTYKGQDTAIRTMYNKYLTWGRNTSEIPFKHWEYICTKVRDHKLCSIEDYNNKWKE